MKVTGDVCKYAAEPGMSEEEALKKGMEEKSKEFVEKGRRYIQKYDSRNAQEIGVRAFRRENPEGCPASSFGEDLSTSAATDSRGTAPQVKV